MAKVQPVYINLYHGRSSIDQDMEDWGDEERDLWFKADFASIEYNPANNGVRMVKRAKDDEVWIYYVTEDLLYYDGFFYGAFSFHGELPADAELSKFLTAKADYPEKKFLFTYKYDVVFEDETFETNEVTVFADKEKESVEALHAWIAKYDKAANSGEKHKIRYEFLQKTKFTNQ